MRYTELAPHRFKDFGADRSAIEASISELCAAKCRDVRTWHGGCRRASALDRLHRRDVGSVGEVARTARHRSPTRPCRAAPRLLAGLPTGKAWYAASSAPWPARLRRARLPERWPDRARLEMRLDGPIDLLVQVRHCRGRHPRAPQSLRNVLDPAHLFSMSISSPPAPISVRVDGSCFVRACPSHLSARAKSNAVLWCGLAAASALTRSAAKT